MWFKMVAATIEGDGNEKQSMVSAMIELRWSS